MTATGCLAPASCPVPSPDNVDLRRLRTTKWPASDQPLWTTYRSDHFPPLFNASGTGGSRFSPLTDTANGTPPIMYIGGSLTVSLLETAFHDVHDVAPRLISAPLSLEPRGALQLRAPGALTLIDLRDDALAQLGLSRGQLVATTAAHYPCTREWAERLVWKAVGRAAPVGLLWRSRVAELAQADAHVLDDLLTGSTAEVAMVIGAPHSTVPTDLDAWHPADAPLAHHPTLHRGEGRALVDQIATLLNATVVDAAVG